MKRFAIMALVATMLLGAVATAQAAPELSVGGYFRVAGEWLNHGPKSKHPFQAQSDSKTSASEDDFNIYQRIRINWRIKANENVSGFIRTQTDWHWGQNPTGDLGITVTRGYIDAKIPNTSVKLRAGRQAVALPSAVAGSPIIDDNFDALIVSVPFNDMFAMKAGFVRASDANNDNDANSTGWYDEADVAFLALPITPEGFSLTPYGAYGWVGKNDAVSGLADANDEANPFWLGLAASVEIADPFVFAGDFHYGTNNADKEVNEIAGWMADFKFTYKGLDFMTPEVFFMYASGTDSDDKGKGTMPEIAGAEDWAVGSFWYGGSSFRRTDFGRSAQGTWTIGASLKKISFMKGLSHDFHALYIRGTNDKTKVSSFGKELSEEDSLFEVDFNTKYALADNLAAIVELGAIFPNFDKDVWTQADDTEAALKMAVGLKYSF